MMPINIEEVIQRAIEQAFTRALEQTIQQKAEEVVLKSFQKGTPFFQKLQDKIGHEFVRFLQEGIQWEEKPG